jgi:CRAL/TRIO domain
MAQQNPDMYGQIHPIETPELLRMKHDEFMSLLPTKLPSDIKTKTSSARNKMKDIVGTDPKYPEWALKEDFVRMFLRCEVYNTELAVVRYVRYWEKRIEIFGPDRAYQPLTSSIDVVGNSQPNNDEGEWEVANAGVINIINRSNDRTYLFLNPSRFDMTKYTRIGFVRTFWCIVHKVLMECHDVQKRGLICLSYPANAKLSQFDRHLMKMILDSLQGNLPVRLSAIHVCHPPLFFSKVIWPILQLLMSRRTRQRILVHSGSYDSVLETLTTQNSFSIDDLPQDIGGNRLVVFGNGG